MADKSLDATGLKSPLPVLRAKKAMDDVRPGGTLEVLVTDPAAKAEFEAFVRTTGHKLILQSEEGGVLRFVFKKTR